MTLFGKKLEKVVKAINDKMHYLLPKVSEQPQDIICEAMRYTALAPAKRIRGALLVFISEIFAQDKQKNALEVAATIEFLHSYSLIHDDLPAMDNDDYRRGQLSCHKKYGEAIAILAGDALLTYAFEILSNLEADSRLLLSIISELSQAIGYKGMIAGQILDISLKMPLSFNQVLKTHEMKTAVLFSASCSIGAILGNAEKQHIAILRDYGLKLGLLFQIADDLADFQSDTKKQSTTSVDSLSNKKLQEYTAQLQSEAMDLINKLPQNAEVLLQAISFVAKTCQK